MCVVPGMLCFVAGVLVGGLSLFLWLSRPPRRY